ncbi:hypothetical protein SBF1_4260002 [Candidatus Desulfosporosinus infrequens]|uniref:Uncharacterized protein n=1 Tax=Candidatus Desulfosporosinus infrequens TaxID=2043169 RepID=A0A2U3LAS7_9FIRM|nr:hypothetical protein SBF1_4260002 [Candidatus Desulfosporosinus infrequens]
MAVKPDNIIDIAIRLINIGENYLDFSGAIQTSIGGNIFFFS